MEASEIIDLIEEAIGKLQVLEGGIHNTAWKAVERRVDNEDEYNEMEDKLIEQFDDTIKDLGDREDIIEALIEKYNDFTNLCENGYEPPEDDYNPYFDPEDEYDPLNR